MSQTMQPKSVTDQHANVTVRAAAGTGKTWLLTSRLMVLLMQGIAPASILAITFTRKAAAEIQQRVNERVLAMVTADDRQLAGQLEALGVANNLRNARRARTLFEKLVCAEYELRATTFHAFCQDILRRFPLEAAVPPGFELLESTVELEKNAWRALQQEATANPAGALAQDLELLLRECRGVSNTHHALSEFLKHRNDWWAYTEGASDPAAQAEMRLRKALSPQSAMSAPSLDATSLRARLRRYSDLLAQASAFSQAALTPLQQACDQGRDSDTLYGLASPIVLTQRGSQRRLPVKRRLLSTLGEHGSDELLSLHRQFIDHLQVWREQQLRHETLQTTSAWHRCGQKLLEHYQHLKAQQNLIDFTDLEWKTYRLLNRSQHAEWVQYKLDQRIDHLLIDEFQDTNPTQWRLLLPLLTEMSSGNDARTRSVFIVGDEKQSIYGFRRADPGLFNAAQSWLTTHMQATSVTQDKSRRSSGAIIDFINLVYSGAYHHADSAEDNSEDFSLQNFRPHETYYHNRWGRVELLPLIRHDRGTNRETVLPLRDPLQQPRQVDEDQRYRAEGDLVASHIADLIGQPIDDGEVRPIEYRDILILLRDRTHAAAYEAALRHAGIPYIGAGRGAFMQCLEIQDLFNLLRALLAHYDNLALASTLRSPIFACENTDLVLLATGAGDSWHSRLAGITAELPDQHRLVRAHRLLSRWRSLADKIPTHDLLDRIYTEGNVSARYNSAAPTHLKNRVTANLRKLLELALEADGGRYPSLSRFVALAPMLADEERHSLIATTAPDQGQVQLMTIHAAKGLEKPIVFLVDAMRDYRRRTGGIKALVTWPVEAARPQHFTLLRQRGRLDSMSAALVQLQDNAVRREEANLLYVALTRAKHAFFVSACEPRRGSGRGWYGFLEKRIRVAATRHPNPMPGLKIDEHADGGGVILEHGTRPSLPPIKVSAVKAAQTPIDPRLKQPLESVRASGVVYPSRLLAGDDLESELLADRPPGDDAKTRGIVIHRMLQQLTSGSDRVSAEVSVMNEFASLLPPRVLTAYWQESCDLVDDPALRALFDTAHYDEAHNELAILYRQGNQHVYGVIDRLLRRHDEIVLIDYKTHAYATTDNCQQLAENFADQLRLYAAGVRKLWQGLRVKTLLVFTAARVAVDMTTRLEGNANSR
jgi:ATP-dependent helicase/nuclease subunit A